jgi:hypothetical protein
MKKLIYVILVTILIALPLLSQKDADREVARTQDFIKATTQKGQAKITALNAYIKKFPETTSRWTRLAHYHLAVEYFTLQKYAECVKYGDKTLKLGSLSPGEEGRLYLIMANSYGVKSASIFNREKALGLAKKALSFAQSNNLKDVLSQAQKLKKQLSGPPPKKISPEQQIKMYYSDATYGLAISYYQKLSAADKSNPEILKTYANALFKENKFDSALKEFQTLYAKDKKGTYAFKIAECYSKKGSRNKQLYGNAVEFYLDAHLLYKKEGSSTNSKVAYKKAEYHLYEKYGYNQKTKNYLAKLKKAQGSAQKNDAAIASKRVQIRKHQRHIRKTYERQDLPTPKYELDKLRKLNSELNNLLNGGGGGSAVDAEGKKLEEEKARIQKELKDMLAKAKTRIG